MDFWLPSDQIPPMRVRDARRFPPHFRENLPHFFAVGRLVHFGIFASRVQQKRGAPRRLTLRDEIGDGGGFTAAGGSEDSGVARQYLFVARIERDFQVIMPKRPPRIDIAVRFEECPYFGLIQRKNRAVRARAEAVWLRLPVSFIAAQSKFLPKDREFSLKFSTTRKNLSNCRLPPRINLHRPQKTFPLLEQAGEYRNLGEEKMTAQNDFWAHTPPEGAPQRPQLMIEHTKNVAEMAEGFASEFGAGELAKWASILHDIGKYSDEFQDYLRRCHTAQMAGKKGKTRPGGGDHKMAGALLSRRLFGGVKENPLAITGLGHHGGMPARKEPATLTLLPELEAQLHEDIARAQEDLQGLLILPESLTIPESQIKYELNYELFTRMLFSCLVDADSLDTERHFHQEDAAQREKTCSFADWLDILNRNQIKLQTEAEAKATTEKAREVNQVRSAVYNACVKEAKNKRGAYRLTVPTGGGKTLSSLAFALQHVLHHSEGLPEAQQMKRIIYAIPYTSIIDQTADVFQTLLGKDAPILIHHSALPDESKPGESDGANGDGPSAWRRLSSQNWDAPLIVTTTVQLFESLFSNKPGRCRKLHNLVNSVIILDEAQMLPAHLLQPIVNTLKILIKHYGVTVVFCTATQPALQEISRAQGLSGFKEMPEIVKKEKYVKHFEIMKRVDYKILRDAQTWEQAGDLMTEGNETQCLAVLNTRANALALLDALNDPKAFHLSTMLCGAHRDVVLTEVRRRLAAGEPCRLVATQVVECGCDLDFPRVLRAVGPFDRVIQAAGRCNRSGNLKNADGSPKNGEAIIFFPEKASVPPGEYKIKTAETTNMIKTGELNAEHDFDLPEICEDYFRRIYGRLTTDAKAIAVLQKDGNYPAVANEFRMIEQDTVPVLVRYAPEAKEAEEKEEKEAREKWAELYDEISGAAQSGKMTRELWRKAQPLLVNVFRRDTTKPVKAGMLIDALPADPGTLYFCAEIAYDSKAHHGLAAIFGDPADILMPIDMGIV